MPGVFIATNGAPDENFPLRYVSSQRNISASRPQGRENRMVTVRRDFPWEYITGSSTSSNLVTFRRSVTGIFSGREMSVRSRALTCVGVGEYLFHFRTCVHEKAGRSPAFGPNTGIEQLICISAPGNSDALARFANPFQLKLHACTWERLCCAPTSANVFASR